MKRTRTPKPEVVADLYAPVEEPPCLHDIVQIHSGTNRGCLAQIGLVEGDVFWCYQTNPAGTRRMMKVKSGEFVRLAKPRCFHGNFEPTPKEREELA